MAFLEVINDSNAKLKLISTHSGADIENNQTIKDHIFTDTLSKNIIQFAKKGIPFIEVGKKTPKVAIISGIHGNELPPQIASMKLIKKLQGKKLEGTIYIIPFAAPIATMNNSRWLNGLDLNRASSNKDSITNQILHSVQNLEVDAVADFHSTKLRSNPGRESVFCTKNPCKESLEIGRFITKKTSSELICYDTAGKMYKGALEDEFNIKGIPAVTCEVLSENGEVNPGSIQRSLLQMESYLKYFNII